MAKTYYTVKYNALGADRLRTATFRTKTEATDFCEQNYADNPVAHHCRKPETIAIFEKLAISTAYELIA